jgi:indolepyruvate ferredoxin oxidoreductase alpha subunit
VLLGNEAIGRGLVEEGCTMVTSYPGTPASEILSAAARFAAEEGIRMHTEWSVNEKVAFETAMAASQAGLPAAVVMKQVGLNVAADPFLRAAYLGVDGGFLVIVADDPGPHSSQTEQDSRFFAMFAKVPVLDPATPREAREMVGLALDLSRRHSLPVMLRPTTRICHARQAVSLGTPRPWAGMAEFVRDVRRWCATPRFVTELHRDLNRKIAAIAAEEALAPVLDPGDGSIPGTALVASGAVWAHLHDLLGDLGLLGRADLWRVPLPYPLPAGFAERLARDYRRVLVLEETYPVMELQLGLRNASGRGTGHVPGHGELVPQVLREVLGRFLGTEAVPSRPTPHGGGERRPTLCAGCGHRAAFYAMRTTFPRGIFPGDIGCYTLGVNLGGVDACHCMGAGISQAAGLWRAYTRQGEAPPIVATIGDSTFFHAGIPALVNLAVQDARVIVVILDNGTTAMTGHQPTPAAAAAGVTLEGLVEASGVRFLRVLDPHHLLEMRDALREADRFCREPGGGPAVIVARRPCVLAGAAPRAGVRPAVTQDCRFCRHCLDRFECPALEEWQGKVRVDVERCTGCLVCLEVCPTKAIVVPDPGGPGRGGGG